MLLTSATSWRVLCLQPCELFSSSLRPSSHSLKDLHWCFPLRTLPEQPTYILQISVSLDFTLKAVIAVCNLKHIYPSPARLHPRNVNSQEQEVCTFDYFCHIRVWYVEDSISMHLLNIPPLP